MALVVTKDTLIGEILDADRSTAPYFQEMGMQCLGCPSARNESLEQACQVHDVDVNLLIHKLNTHLSKKPGFLERLFSGKKEQKEN